MYPIKRCATGMAIALLMAAFAPAQAAGEQQGLRIVRDPDTGKLRAPSAEEVRKMEEKAAKKAGVVTNEAEPVSYKLKNGGVGARLPESTMSYSVLTRKADGTTAMQCVTGEHAAHAHTHAHVHAAASNASTTVVTNHKEQGHETR